MEFARKKTLPQNVALIQSNVIITPEVLRTLKQHGVITAEEATTIEKDDTPSGKVLELVCLIKRKDVRTFTKFLTALEELGFSNVADILRNKPDYTDTTKPDASTVSFLSTIMGNVDIKIINNIAKRLVPKEVYNDDVQTLKEEIESLRNYQSVLGNTSPASCRSTPPTGRPNKQTAAENSKDLVVRRWEEDYQKLAKDFENLQQEYEQVLELNSDYVEIISKLNLFRTDRDNGAAARQTEKLDEIIDLESRVDEYKQQVADLQISLRSVADELTIKNKELEKIREDERRLRRKLKLPDNATDEDINKAISDLMNKSSSNAEIVRMQKDLQKLTNDKQKLEETVGYLIREKQRTEFSVRQKDLQIKRLCRMNTAKPALYKAQTILAQSQEYRLPSIVGLNSPQSSTPHPLGLSNNLIHYCVFCRCEYQQRSKCRIHIKAYRDGNWTCCGEESHRSPGCLKIPHFFIQKSDEQILLTDGGQYMKLS